MKLEHSFTVPTGIEEAWKILLDIERIGPCMPGAAIESVDGDDFTGSVKVKLGPIGLTYKGKASFIEKDAAAHRAVIDARGRDARGNGTASAKVTATMTEQGPVNTLVKVDTDLDITGKPAQFGRGVMVDVGNKLIGQFADNLAATIGGEPAPAPAPARKRASRPKPAGVRAGRGADGGVADDRRTGRPDRGRRCHGGGQGRDRRAGRRRHDRAAVRVLRADPRGGRRRVGHRRGRRERRDRQRERRGTPRPPRCATSSRSTSSSRPVRPSRSGSPRRWCWP